MSAGNGFFTRDPFPGNIIPPSLINPIAQTLAQYWPKPSGTGGADGSNNFKPNTPSPTAWNQTFVRGDHNFSDKDKLLLQMGLLNSDIAWDDDYNTLATGHHQTIRREAAGVDFIHIINPQMLAHLRVGVTRVADKRVDKSNVSAPGGGYDITKLGLAPSLIPQLDLAQSSLPETFVTGYNGIHDNVRNNIDNPTTGTLGLEFDYNKGNHNLQAGADFWLIQYNSANNQYTMPAYTFDPTYTNGPFNNSPTTPLAQSLAAFLLGQPTSGYIVRPASLAAQNRYYGFYVQDNWRLTTNLTINFGLRYEYYAPVTERYNRSVRGFAANLPNPINNAAQAAYAINPAPGLPPAQFQAMGGLTFAGVDGQPRELYDTSKLNFAPRFGFAYRLPANTVIRGGYGIYFVPIGLDGPGNLQPTQEGFSRQTALVPTLNNGVTFVANLQNPFPNGILSPTGSSLGLATNVGESISFLNTDNLKSPYVQNWSLSLQHLFPALTTLQMSYVGSRSVKLIIPQNLDALPAQYLSTVPYRDQQTITFLSQSYPNPFAGLVPGTSLNTSLTTLRQLLLPYPEFTGVTLNQSNLGSLDYNSLQVQVEKRMSHGLSAIFAYTLSKSMDSTQFLNPTDPTPIWTVSANDHTHAIALAAIYQLPFGTDQKFASDPPAGLRPLISGWKFAPVLHAVSGFPIDFSGQDVFVNGSFSPKTLALPGSERTVNHWFNTSGFVTDPGEQPQFHLRTFPLRFSGLRTAWVNYWDMSLVKDTRLREDMTLQFQAQFLNALNQTSFGPASTNPAVGSFGAITSEMTWPRRIMFGLRLRF